MTDLIMSKWYFYHYKKLLKNEVKMNSDELDNKQYQKSQ